MTSSRKIDPSTRVRWPIAAAALSFLLVDSLVLSSAAGDPPPETIEIQALIRDFKQDNEPGGHPDFERNKELDLGGYSVGVVATMLGSDFNPVFTGADAKVDNEWQDADGNKICWTMFGLAPDDDEGSVDLSEPSGFTNAANFDEWYRDVPGVNLSTVITLTLNRQDDGTYVYDDQTDPVHGDSDGFFPIDGQLFGNSPANTDHNYHFTTEIHCRFTYDALAGQMFMFIGDDDVWVFINGQLVVELAGTHGDKEQYLDLNRLDLAHGDAYTLSLFHAERQTDGSNFRFQTNLVLRDALYTASITQACD